MSSDNDLLRGATRPRIFGHFKKKRTYIRVQYEAQELLGCQEAKHLAMLTTIDNTTCELPWGFNRLAPLYPLRYSYYHFSVRLVDILRG